VRAQLPGRRTQRSQNPNLRERAFWTCFLLLAWLAAGYGVALAIFLVNDTALDPPVRAMLACQVAIACWVLALPAIWLIARIESRWIARHVQQPIAWMIEQCRDIRQGRAAAHLTHGGRTDEIASLALAINELLAHFNQNVVRQHRFVADAAHELRTPLTAQSLVGENVLARKATSAELREAVGSMLEESKHMKRLIESLLDLTRASVTKATDPDPCRKTTPLDLSELARGCVESLQILAEEKRQRIRLSVAEPVWVDVDSTVVRQALLNVIHNAIEHCHVGACIDVETSRSSHEEGAIRVQDDGPGIPLEQQPRVFERFYRGSGGRRGLGLGLSIARALLKSQRGNIQLHSHPGAGCCFTLTLPLIPHLAGCRDIELYPTLAGVPSTRGLDSIGALTQNR
jgi:signal transduction histidine kinase